VEKKILSRFKSHFLNSYHHYILYLTLALSFSCNDEIVSPPVKQEFTRELKGKVILENQTEHSNALVYLDSLNRGVSTDSSGNYTLIFTDEDSVYDGVFKICYFVNEFEMDSAYYAIVDGKIKLDSLDVDSEGRLPEKNLKQLLRIEGWTDKQEYRIGDKIDFKVRFTNVSNRPVYFFIYSIFNQLGFVSLYNENYPAFTLSPCDPVSMDLDGYIGINGYYEGRVIYEIRNGNYCGDFIPLPIDKFIVVADLFIERRLQSPYDKFERFLIFNWDEIDRGETPQLDWFPNKYRFPIVRIIE
jgi:hypothetical protein